MSIDKEQFRLEIIRTSLKLVDLWSEEAEELLLGTAAQESHLGTYIRQINGPAIGVFQMEPVTYHDILSNWLAYRPELSSKVKNAIPTLGYPQHMVYDMRHAAIMCRLHYLRRPEPLPDVDDLRGQAEYWKQFYNTSLGKGSVVEYIANYHKFIKGKG